MAIRDVVVLNTTASRLETQQSTDTVRIKGSSSEILSVENSSGTSVLSINTSTPSVTITGDITTSGAFSGSLASTASFGRVDSTKLAGSAAGLTNTDKDGTISGSAQIASEVSGAFSSGFNVAGNISGSSVSSGSFSIVSGSTISGDGSGLSNSIPTNVVSGAAQLADNISGSFTNGFEFTGDISGSVNSTGSFGNLFVGGFLIGDGSRLINVTPDSSFSGSVQLANDISGSFIKGFNYEGEISGSVDSTGSFTTLTAEKLVGDGSQLTNKIPVNTLSSSAQFASEISGAFDSGFNYSGIISGSSTATASFGRIDVTNLSATSVDLTNCRPVGLVSSSAQLASQISGAFDSGFEFTGTIQPSLGAWSAGGALNTGRSQDGGVGTKDAFIATDGSGKTEIYNGSSWSEVNDMISGYTQQEAAGSSTSALVFGGWVYAGAPAPQAGSEEWNGTNWSEQVQMPMSRSTHVAAGQTTADSALAFAGSSGGAYPSPTDVDTIEWNGSSWSTYSETGFPTHCRYGIGLGSTEAALYHGHSSLNKTWDGSSWSSITNSTSIHFKGDGGGTVNDALIFAGMDDFGVYSKGFCTELFDGSSWSTQGALSIARTYPDGGGTVAGNSMVVGGAPGLTSVEHFSLSFNTGSFTHLVATKLTGDASGLSNIIPSNTVSSSAQIASDVSGSFTSGFEFPTGNIRYANGVWSAEAALASSISYHGAAGDKTGQIVAMGLSGNNAYASLDATRTFEYNGSTWSEAGDNNTNRARAAGAGSVNSAVFFGGYAPNWYGQSQGATEIYNGTNFSEVADLIIPRRSHMGAGLSSNAALALGGYQDSAPLNPAFFPNMRRCTEVWDGSTWTESGDAPANMQRGGMAGSVNAAVAFGSNIGPAATTIHWNGSTWSSGGTGHSPIGIDNTHGGTQNDAISAGSGYISPYVYTPRTQYYDGTVWRTGPNMTTELAHRGMGHNQGNAGGALAAGGEGGAPFAGCTNTESHTEAVASASIAHLITSTIDGDGSNLTNCLHPATYISSSTQIADDISGSFTNGFEFTNTLGSISSVWSTGGYLIHGCNFGAGWGTQNAAAFATNGITEEYDGTVWSANAYAMSSSRECHTGIGTQTAGLVFGGILTPGGSMSDKTETYDGSVWAQVNTMQEARKAHSGAGTQNAGLAFGGVRVPGLVACSEEWNGTNWSEGNDLITARCVLAGSGTQNAGLAIGGKSPSYETDTEEYNGTSYAAGGHLPTATACLAAAGTQNYSIAFGGNQNPTIVATTVEYDGTAWTSRNSLGTAVEKHNAAGDGSNGLSFSGGPVTRGTEEFTGGTITSASFGKLVATTLQGGDISGITGLNEGSGILSSSAQMASDISGSFISGFEFSGLVGRTSDVWSTGGALAKAIGYHSQWGTQNASLVAGAASGSIAPHYFNGTQIYNGTTWNNTGHTLNQGRSSTAGTGTDSESGILIGGYFNYKQTEEYDGTSWTEVNDIITERFNGMLFGNTEAAIVTGGETGINNTESWNGTNWSAVNNLIRSAHNTAEGGTQNAGIIFGGGDGAYAVDNCTDEWNGTNWSAGGAMINNSYTAAGNGIQNSAWSRHCHPNSQNTGATTEFYNGTSWSSGPLGLVDSYSSQGSGTRSAGLLAGGNKHPYTPANYHTCTEHLDGPSIATGSIGNIVANTLIGDASNMINILPNVGMISGSAQIASAITGSFIKGFEFTGTYGNSIGAWTTAASMIDSRYNHTGAGVQDATVAIAGYCDGGSPYTFAKVEHYNGNIWSAGGDLPYARAGHGAAGSQTATVAWGGFIYGSPVRCKTTNEYNGTSWASANDFPIIIGNERGAGIGTQTAAMSVGGNPHSSYQGSGSFMYDGLNWSKQMELANSYLSATVSVGSVNAAITYGGSPSTNHAVTCNWDGSTWSNTGANMINTAVDHSGGGTQNAAYSAYSPAVPGRTVTEFWNGSAWSQGPDMVYTKMDFSKGNGTTQAGIMFGASHAPNYNLHCTELWNQTFTTGSSTFNSNYKGVSGSLKHVEANKLVICRENKLKASKSFQLPFFTSDPITGSLVTGAQASDIITGSALTSGSDMSQYFGEVWWNKTENKLKFSFPVNAWSEVADLNTAKGLSFGAAGSGIHDALAFGGATAGLSPVVCTRTTELWNGTSWSEVADLQDDMLRTGGTGCSSNAAIMTGAASSNPIALFQSKNANTWDGIVWTEVSDHITSRGCTSMSGTANAGLLAPGVVYGGSGSPTTEEWNGTNWTTSTNASLSYGQYNAQLIGTQNDTIQGADPGPFGRASHYDGTSWATINNYSDYCSRAGFGTANAAIYAGGCSPSPSGAEITISEEYNGVAWSQASQLGQGRAYGFRAGTQGSGMLSGGSKGHPGITVYANTEMYYTHYIKTGCE